MIDYFVPGTRIELVQPQWPQDFKSCVSTSSTTRAAGLIDVNINYCGFQIKSLLGKRGISSGAKDEVRTRDPDLGKVVLYQLSYFRLFLGGQKYIFFFSCKIFMRFYAFNSHLSFFFSFLYLLNFTYNFFK